jgi:CBS domain-containing protein
MVCPACGSENIDGNDRCENCLAPFRDLDIPRADAAEGLARSVMEGKLSELAYDETVLVSPDTPASEVAQRMKNAQIGCALVVKNDKLVGIFTEHDVLKALTKSEAPIAFSDATRSTESLPVTDAPYNDMPLEEMRAEEMTVEQNQLGLIWPHDAPVSELMSRDPETLYEHDSVAAALNKMSLGRYRHLPVERMDGSYRVASIKSVLRYIASEDW